MFAGIALKIVCVYFFFCLTITKTRPFSNCQLSSTSWSSLIPEPLFRSLNPFFVSFICLSLSLSLLVKCNQKYYACVTILDTWGNESSDLDRFPALLFTLSSNQQAIDALCFVCLSILLFFHLLSSFNRNQLCFVTWWLITIILKTNFSIIRFIVFSDRLVMLDIDLHFRPSRHLFLNGQA